MIIKSTKHLKLIYSNTTKLNLLVILIKSQLKIKLKIRQIQINDKFVKSIKKKLSTVEEREVIKPRISDLYKLKMTIKDILNNFVTELPIKM